MSDHIKDHPLKVYAAEARERGSVDVAVSCECGQWATGLPNPASLADINGAMFRLQSEMSAQAALETRVLGLMGGER